MSRVVHIASQQLETAGAYYTGATATPLRGNWNSAQGETCVTLAITYTKHASATNGRARLKIYWTLAADEGPDAEFQDTAIDASLATSGTTATAGVYDMVLDLVATTNGNPARKLVEIRAPRAATKIRVEPAEVGDTANPGTIVVEIDGRV